MWNLTLYFLAMNKGKCVTYNVPLTYLKPPELFLLAPVVEGSD